MIVIAFSVLEKREFLVLGRLKSEVVTPIYVFVIVSTVYT